jgi:hypothetical protein
MNRWMQWNAEMAKRSVWWLSNRSSECEMGREEKFNEAVSCLGEKPFWPL